jgi:hypothetical protein
MSVTNMKIREGKREVMFNVNFEGVDLRELREAVAAYGFGSVVGYFRKCAELLVRNYRADAELVVPLRFAGSAEWVELEK